MDLKRRDFVKGCTVTSACVLFLPGGVSAMQDQNKNGTLPSDTDLHIQKSIKAGFGGSFSVRAHTQSNGLTYADIEHLGNRYAVASADLLNWKVVKSL